MWDRLMPTYYAELGASDLQIGTVFSGLAASLALFQLVGGLMADQVGRKPVAVLPVFGVVAAVGWMAQARDWRGLLVGHLGLTLFASLQSPGFTALLAESVPPAERGRAFSAVAFASRVAGTAGPALGAWLLGAATTASHTPALTTLMWITVGVGMAVSLTRLLLLRETLAAPTQPAPLDSAWGEVSRRTAAGFLAIGVIYATTLNLVLDGPFIALHARQVLRLNNVKLNLLFAAGEGAAMLFVPLAGWLGDRAGHRWLLAGGVLAMGTGVLGWALTPAGWLGTACFVLAAASASAAGIAYSALLTGVVEGRRRAGFVGLMGTVTGLLGSPAARAGAALRARAGSTAPFWAGLGLAVLLALALASRRPLSQPAH